MNSLGAGVPQPVSAAGLAGAQARVEGHGWDLEWVFRRLVSTPRWLGQAADRKGRTLTVAHHSIWCSRVAWTILEMERTELRAGTALWALLHDGHEA